MADEFMGLTQGVPGGRAGTNPVAHVQLITYNGFTADWKLRRNESRPKYKGPVDADHMTVLKAEPTVAERAIRIQRHTGSLDKETTLRVFCSLNGWGHEDWSKYHCLQQLRWGGFKGYRTHEDKNDMYTTNDFPVYHGGLFTTINNGDKNIMHGDLIYWDIPEDEKEAVSIMKSYKVDGTLSGARGNRRTVFLRPYDPKDQTVNRKLVRTVVDRPYKTTSSNVVSYAATLAGRDGYIHKSNANLVETLKMFGALCVLADRNNLIGAVAGPDEMFAALVSSIRRENHTSLFRTMGLLGTVDEDSVMNGHHLMQALMRIVAPKDHTERIFGVADESPAARAMNKIQRGDKNSGGTHGNLLDFMIASIIEGNDYIKRRIIAVARSSAASGQPIDIIALP